jgi:hypothetical protein
MWAAQVHSYQYPFLCLIVAPIFNVEGPCCNNYIKIIVNCFMLESKFYLRLLESLQPFLSKAAPKHLKQGSKKNTVTSEIIMNVMKKDETAAI